jgi:hypothetical protein
MRSYLRLRHSRSTKMLSMAAPPAIHADHDPMPFQGADEIAASELATLVGIEDFRSAIARERVLERRDAKIGVERVGEAPGEHRVGRSQDRYWRLARFLQPHIGTPICLCE